MIQRRPSAFALVSCVTAGLLGACERNGPGGDSCRIAADGFEACGLTAPAGFAARCAEAPEAAVEIEGLSCEDLVAAIDQIGKADLPGFDRAEGEPCGFNLQCNWAEGLVCRPLELAVSVGSSFTVDHACQLVGRNGEFCDNESDCTHEDPCSQGVCLEHDRGGH